MTQHLLPDLPGFSIERMSITNGVITVLACSQTTSGHCPECAHLSSRIHSRYQRTLADLPWSGRIVRLVVQVHRFFCTQPTCRRKTFSEALPAMAERYARRTNRLKAVLEHLGLALGGEPASRLTAVLAMGCSPDTVLRLLHRLPDEPVEAPRVVSLDDWAWRRGHRYGTLICDLERHRRLDVLPDREVASVAAWLGRYPSIEIISRDRSDTYATAARLGAPQALQVTDRWHLLKNLGEAVQRCLSHHLTIARKQQTEVLRETVPALQSKRTPYLSPLQKHTVQLHRTERLARYEQAVALRKQGFSYQAIAERVGVGHSTVQRWVEAGAFPERKRREQASQLDPYLPFIRKRWEEGCHNMARLSRELTTKGYQGSYESVRNLVNRLRQGERHAPLQKETPLSSRQATWVFLHRPEELTTEEQQTLARLRTLDPEVDLAYELVQQFTHMMRERTGKEQLDGWLEKVARSPLTALHPLRAGISQDKAAVQAGLTYEWNQGQIEGQITRLKLIKRQGYGRAGFDLLRKRVLHAA